MGYKPGRPCFHRLFHSFSLPNDDLGVHVFVHVVYTSECSSWSSALILSVTVTHNWGET